MAKVQSAMNPALAALSLTSGALQGLAERKKQMEYMQFQEKMQMNKIGAEKQMAEMNNAHQKKMLELQSQYAIAMQRGQTDEQMRLAREMDALQRDNMAANTEVRVNAMKYQQEEMYKFYKAQGYSNAEARARAFGPDPRARLGGKGGPPGPKTGLPPGYVMVNGPDGRPMMTTPAALSLLKDSGENPAAAAGFQMSVVPIPGYDYSKWETQPGASPTPVANVENPIPVQPYTGKATPDWWYNEGVTPEDRRAYMETLPQEERTTFVQNVVKEEKQKEKDDAAAKDKKKREGASTYKVTEPGTRGYP